MNVNKSVRCKDISPMESKLKSWHKLKFGICIKKIIENNKSIQDTKADRKKSHIRITSLRSLAAASGIEYAIIQKITTGKRNPQLTTIIAIAEGLGISEVDLFQHYSKVTEDDVKKAEVGTKSKKH